MGQCCALPYAVDASCTVCSVCESAESDGRRVAYRVQCCSVLCAVPTQLCSQSGKCRWFDWSAVCSACQGAENAGRVRCGCRVQCLSYAVLFSTWAVPTQPCSQSGKCRWLDWSAVCSACQGAENAGRRLAVKLAALPRLRAALCAANVQREPK